jgi:hypothetical protein
MSDDIPDDWRTDPLEDTPPSRAVVLSRLRYYRSLIDRLTPEQRQRLRDSFRPEGVVADGDLTADLKP